MYDVPLLRAPSLYAQSFLDRKEVLDRVMTVIKNFEKVDQTKVTPTAHFVNDLSLDSLDAVEVAMALEEEFMITIPDAEVSLVLLLRVMKQLHLAGGMNSTL